MYYIYIIIVNYIILNNINDPIKNVTKVFPVCRSIFKCCIQLFKQYNIIICQCLKKKSIIQMMIWNIITLT